MAFGDKDYGLKYLKTIQVNGHDVPVYFYLSPRQCKAESTETQHWASTTSHYFKYAVRIGANLWLTGDCIRYSGGVVTDDFDFANPNIEWQLIDGTAQKQPKTTTKQAVIDEIGGSYWENISAEMIEEFHRIEHARYSTSGLVEAAAAATAKVEELNATIENLKLEKEEIVEKVNPSLETIMNQALVQTLQPIMEGKAKEMAEEIMGGGGFPQTLRIQIGEKVAEMEGIFHEKFEYVTSLVANGLPVFLVGDAGTGKNVLAEQVASALERPFHYMGQVMDKYTDCVGFADANGEEHDTPLIRAAKDGGLLFIDEIDASIPEVLITVNSLLANGYFVTGWGEHVTAHDDFRVICAGNTVGRGADKTYTGRYTLDGATLDRFSLVEIDYDARVESAIAKGDEQLVEFIQALRESIKEISMVFPVTYRATKAVTQMKEVGFPLTDVMRACVTKYLGVDDLRVLKDRVGGKIATSNPYYIALASLAS